MHAHALEHVETCENANGMRMETAAGVGSPSGVAPAALDTHPMPVAKPPVCNTGVKMPNGPDGRVALDWIQGTFGLLCEDGREAQLSRMRETLRYHFGDITPAERAFYGFAHMEMTAAGCFLAWSDDKAYAMFSIPGKCMATLDGEGQLSLFQVLHHQYHAKWTRLDIAFDDFTRSILPAAVHAACQAKEVSGFRSITWHEKSSVGADEVVEKGSTCEMGRRGKKGGGKQLVCYDKLLESGGEVPSVRWELRVYKDFAEVAGLVLSQSEDVEQFTVHLASFIGGAVDFLENTGDKHKERRPRVAWWQNLLDMLGQAKLTAKRPKPTLVRTMKHIERAYAPSLASIADAMQQLGGDFYAWFADVIQLGQERQGERHKAMVKEAVHGRPADVGKMMEAA